MYIYLIRNTITQKCYVGQTIRSIEKRFKVHCYDARRHSYRSYLHYAINKYGKEVFTVELLETCNPKDLDVREKYWIRYLDTIQPNGYNIKCGGAGSPLEHQHKKQCSCCHKTFFAKTKRKVYCSIQCETKQRYHKNKKPIDQRHCIICDIIFTPSKVRQKYCSLSCRRAKFNIIRKHQRALDRITTKTCVMCNNDFTTNVILQKYCSAACLRIKRNRNKREKKEKLPHQSEL